MSNLEKQIADIRVKLERFVEENQANRNNLSEYALKIHALKERIEEKDEKINHLETRIEKMRIAKTLEESGENPANVRAKINELIRGIDRCIAQLNQ